MSTDLLKDRLCYDLKSIGLPVEEVDVYMRPYSKTYMGRYFPVYDKSNEHPRLFLYPFEDREGKFFSYDVIVDTGVHEMVHHIQHSNPNWKRLNHIMHDTEFWRLYNSFMLRAKILGVIKNEYKSETA